MKFTLFGITFFCCRDQFGHFKAAIQVPHPDGGWTGPMLLRYKDHPGFMPRYHFGWHDAVRD